MKYLKTVYVFRYDEKMHTWSRRELSSVLISGTLQNYSLSDTLNRDAYCVLRVMQNTDADVLPGDVVVFEVPEGDVPPDKNRAVVVSVTKNNRGSKRVQHTKIICR